MHINLQEKTDSILAGLVKPSSLLLHVCCAPCGGYPLEYLSQYFDVTISFYNPNIYPREEYDKRLDTLNALLRAAKYPNPVRLLPAPYDPEPFMEAVRGLEEEPEGGRRCEVCLRLRLAHTAALAKQQGSNRFCTTLSVSPRKNALLLHEIAEETARSQGVAALPADFKKRGGFQRSTQICRELGLYRQSYCGCSFSMR